MPDAGENAAIQQKRVFTQPERKADVDTIDFSRNECS